MCYRDSERLLSTGHLFSSLKFRAFLFSLLDNVLNHKNRYFSMMGDPRGKYPVSNSLLESDVLPRSYLFEPIRPQDFNYPTLR